MIDDFMECFITASALNLEEKAKGPEIMELILVRNVQH